MSNKPLVTPEELRQYGSDIFGGAYGWQSALARLLDVNPRRVRAWLAGKEPIPIAIAAEVAALAGSTATGVLPIDGNEAGIYSYPKWIIGTDARSGDEEPEFLVHTRKPRFVALLVYESEVGSVPGPSVYKFNQLQMVVKWFDKQPNPDEAETLMTEGWRAIHDDPDERVAT